MSQIHCQIRLRCATKSDWRTQLAKPHINPYRAGLTSVPASKYHRSLREVSPESLHIKLCQVQPKPTKIDDQEGD